MKVPDGQQFFLAPLQPLRTRQILALRAVTVPARIVTDALLGAVAASFHMPAERGRAAVFDGPHQLVLVGWQSMFPPVAGPAGAEDVGHFDSGSSQGVLPGRGRPLGIGGVLSRPAELRLDGRSGLIERGDDVGQTARRDGGVAARGFDAAMPEQDLNHSRVSAVFKQMRGKTVTQQMGRDPLGNVRNPRCIAADLLDRTGVDMLVGTRGGEEPFLRPLDQPVFPQDRQHPMTEHAEAVAPSFAFPHPHQHSRAVDVTDLQAAGFRDAQSRPVAEHQDRSMTQQADGLEEPLHLFGGKHCRQTVGRLGVGEVHVGPRHLQHLQVEELRGTDKTVHRGWRQFPVL